MPSAMSSATPPRMRFRQGALERQEVSQAERGRAVQGGRGLRPRRTTAGGSAAALDKGAARRRAGVERASHSREGCDVRVAKRSPRAALAWERSTETPRPFRASSTTCWTRRASRWASCRWPLGWSTSATSRKRRSRPCSPPRRPLPAPALARADPLRVQQAIWNVLASAVNLSSEGDLVLVSEEVEGREVALRVSDYGSGIDPEHLPRVFDRFWQDADAPSRAGLGLGLRISRHVAERHGGRVAARARGAGAARRSPCGCRWPLGRCVRRPANGWTDAPLAMVDRSPWRSQRLDGLPPPPCRSPSSLSRGLDSVMARRDQSRLASHLPMPSGAGAAAATSSRS